uniref:Solute carrier family 12 member 10, tandem duplicate 1 n=1 Tax=Oryzias latipes TaxID=8090 RepID=A0A3P9L0Z5_ORYLA
RSSLYSNIDLVPQLEYYARTIKHQQARSRPSLEVLRKTIEEVEVGVGGDNTSEPQIEGEQPPTPKGKTPIRFGWIIGVAMRVMVNIWGVILFLRLTWITSQAGIVLTYVIILISVTITSLTALSISAIATNGRVISGGTYFMISRTLGPEIGGPIGIMYSFANTLAVALNTVGYAEVVRDMMRELGVKIVDDTNDVRIVGVVTVTVLMLIAVSGMEWESKTQIFFFLVMLVAFTNYIVGTILPQSIEKQAKGLFGYKADIFLENLVPSWRGPQGNFFRMFAVFFPGATGILAGVNICGDLKDPASAIPKGTLWAIFWTTFSYLVISITAGACVVRDASGNVSDIIAGNHTDFCVGLACQHGWNFTNCIQSQTCKYGLSNSVQIMGQLSGYYYIIFAGIFAATLSSALGFLVSAPKVFQCLCKDQIYPFIIFFAKGYGKNHEPLRAYVLCYLIAVGFIVIAELNNIAALISNFFLCSYALINFSCFHASFINAPGWRPSFRYYSKWASLFAATIAVILMFLFTWWAALVTLSIIIFLYGYVNYKKPKLNWGSSIQAGTYNMALSYSVSLTTVEEHVKNYRPQCLVLTGPPNQRPALVDFVGCFTKNTSLMICGDIIMEQDRKSRPENTTDAMVKWLNKRKVRAFYTPFTGDNLRTGAHHLLQASGLGKLKPDTLVLGFKANWRNSSPETIEDYINSIYDTFDFNYCLCILRMMDGLDVTADLDFEELSTFLQNFHFDLKTNKTEADDVNPSVNDGFEADEPEEPVEDHDPQSNQEDPGITRFQRLETLLINDADMSDEGNSNQIKTVFQNDQGKKTIDVYWIADDGGLTLLVPYLLTRRKRWHRCKVRVFIVGDEQNQEEERKEMTLLVNRFRLNVKDVIIMTDSEKRPQAKSLTRFVDSVAPFRLFDEQQEGVSVQDLRQSAPWKISDKEFEVFRQKSERMIRLNEIIRKNSQHTALVLVSLPVPNRDCPSALYMAWLDTLTYGLHCPAVLIRGNQKNVMTLYC